MQNIRELTERGVVEAAGEAGGARLFKAKISHVDKVNANKRLLPEAVMRREIERLGPLLQAGHITAALDHIGPLDGGNLKDTCAVWREIGPIGADGSVMGRFAIVPTTRGADLQAMITAGVGVGFSTLASCTLRAPSAAEKRQWGIGGDVQVYGEDFRLLGVDVVSNPSVESSRLLAESRGTIAADMYQRTLQVEAMLVARRMLEGHPDFEAVEAELTHLVQTKGADAGAVWLAAQDAAAGRKPAREILAAYGA